MNTIDLAMSEGAWLNEVVDYAQAHGWLVYHARPARTKKGWRTPTQGDVGFPDLVLVRFDGKLVFAELKSHLGKVTPGQQQWLSALRLRWPMVYVWRPSDREEMQRVLE